MGNLNFSVYEVFFQCSPQPLTHPALSPPGAAEDEDVSLAVSGCLRSLLKLYSGSWGEILDGARGTARCPWSKARLKVAFAVPWLQPSSAQLKLSHK